MTLNGQLLEPEVGLVHRPSMVARHPAVTPGGFVARGGVPHGVGHLGSRPRVSGTGRTRACGRAPRRPRRRPASSGHPRTTAAATPLSFVHHEARRAGDLVGERDHGVMQLAPVRSSRPRRSSSGSIPAQPIATSTCPSRHGRPKVSVTSTASSTPKRADEGRAQARGRGVGVERQQRDDAGRDAVRLVDAGVGAHPAVLVSTIRCPRSMRTMRVVSRSTTSTARGSLSGVAPARELLGERRGLDVRRASTTRPSAFDTTFWQTTTTSRGLDADRAASIASPSERAPGRRRAGSSAGPGHGMMATVMRSPRRSAAQDDRGKTGGVRGRAHDVSVTSDAHAERARPPASRRASAASSTKTSTRPA